MCGGVSGASDRQGNSITLRQFGQGCLTSPSPPCAQLVTARRRDMESDNQGFFIFLNEKRWPMENIVDVLAIYRLPGDRCERLK